VVLVDKVGTCLPGNGKSGVTHTTIYEERKTPLIYEEEDIGV